MNPAKQYANPTAALVVGAVIFLATIGAYIYCESNHLPSGPMLYLAGPVIAALLIANRVDVLGARTNAKIEDVKSDVQTVKHQTNGQLTERLQTIHGELEARMPDLVASAVRDVLVARDTTATAGALAGVAPAPALQVVPPAGVPEVE